ncbi:MAG: hypothetical protein KDE58_17875, partial [Caldilineaceae bacterium]|nr:hypothetical protein [Caldilineaceae bacterium]
MKIKRNHKNEMPNGSEQNAALSQGTTRQAGTTARSQRAIFTLAGGGSGGASALARKRLMHLWGSVDDFAEFVQFLVMDNDAKYQELFGPREFVLWEEVPA